MSAGGIHNAAEPATPVAGAGHADAYNAALQCLHFFTATPHQTVGGESEILVERIPVVERLDEDGGFVCARCPADIDQAVATDGFRNRVHYSVPPWQSVGTGCGPLTAVVYRTITKNEGDFWLGAL